METKMVRIIIYSDQPILAKGLESLIASDPALQLHACCSKVAALKELLANDTPDLAVLDLTPEITAAALHELQTLAPESKIILWTNTIAGDFALRALTMGVRGVLRKTLPLDAHRQCLHRVAAGDLWFEKSLTDSFRAARRVSLSPRESQLVSMLVRGLKNKEISHQLGITEGTVKVYLSHLFQKSGAKDRFELALQGIKNLGMAGIAASDQGGLRSLMMEPACHP
jgi:two-component system nitrate/nitrite response regulator NarL